MADAVQDDGVDATLKWPHDVLIHGRKVAGVRAEGVWGDPGGDLVILGVGVNLNVPPETLRAALGGQAGQFATSLCAELGRPVDRSTFAARFLNHLGAWMVLQRQQGLPAVITAWEDREIVTHRRIEVRQGDQRLEGRALGVNAQGHLLLQAPAGSVHTVRHARPT